MVNGLVDLNSKVYVASKDNKNLVNKKVKKFYNIDLSKLSNCIKVTKNMDIIFNLLGITGSPKMNIENPASFMF